MTKVHVLPLPEKFKNIPKKWRPGHPPIFWDISPEGITEKDRELARELFLLLDPESQEWYGRRGTFEGL